MPAVTTQATGIRLVKKRDQLDLSVIIVSYNTRDVLDRCLGCLREAAAGLSLEILIVDNGSKDGSVEMLERQHPDVQVIRSEVNLGFGAANNRALSEASGRYFVLLNSDAFLRPEALRRSIEHMEQNPGVGLAGARLIGPTENWQPSARSFPSILNDFLSLSGLAYRFPRSRFFGRADRTWSDPLEPAEVDWVPGAFSIINPKALEATGVFDEDFFLYYEEVDLCRRIKALGFQVLYWPDVVVMHLGGESSKRVPEAVMSSSGSQLTLWRMRSEMIYYRKHHGHGAFFRYQMERLWYRMRRIRNGLGAGTERQAKAAESQNVVQLMDRAWKETSGGRISPPRPW